MTSKTSSVSLGKQTLGVCLWQLRRSAPLAAVFTGILLVVYPVTLSLGMFHSGPFGLPYGPEGAFGMARAATLGAMAGSVLFSLVLTVFHFGSLYSKRQEDLFHALPVRREALFLGGYLAELLCLFVPLLLGLLLESALFAAFGLFTSSFLNYVLATLGLALLMDALVAAFFALPALCSGTVLECVTSAGLLTVLWPALVLGVKALVSASIPGYLPYFITDGLQFVGTALSPPFSILVAFLYHDNNQEVYSNFPGWAVFFWLALLIVLIFLCLLVCRRRKSEAAEATCSYGPLKTLLRILGGTAVGLIAGVLMFEFTGSAAFFYTGAVLGLLLVYLFTELLYFRTFRKLLRHLPCLAGTTALLGVILLSVSLGLGMDTAMPDLGKVVGVTLSVEGYPATSSTRNVRAVDTGEYQDYQQLTALLTGEENLQKMTALNEKLLAYKRAEQYPYLPGSGSGARYYVYGQMINIAYSLESGETLHRSYSPSDALSGEAEQLFQEARDLALELTREEEYVRSLPQINMLDAAVQIGKTTSYLTDEEWFGKNSRQNHRGESDVWTLSEFSDGEAFREKLEAALVSDLTHGRYPEEEEKRSSLGSYYISYGENKIFTAKGGWAGTEPAAGRQFLTDTDHNPDFRIYPEMTETYALLESLYETEKYEKEQRY